MSDPESDGKSNGGGGRSSSAPPSAGTVSEIEVAYTDLKSKKQLFDVEVEKSVSVISQDVQRVQAASSQALSLRDDIANARNTADVERAAVQELAAKARASQTEIENIKTAAATAKGAIDAAQTAATGELAAISQSRTEIETLKASALTLSERLSADHDKIGAQIAALQEQQKALQTLTSELSEAKATVLKDAEVAKAHTAETENARTAFSRLNTETQTQYNALVQRQATLQTKISEIEAANAQIIELRRVLLENTKGGPKSIRDQINDLQTGITEILTEVEAHRDAATVALRELEQSAQITTENLVTTSQQRFDALYKELQEKILSLLPSAGAAGLSSTYYDAKSRYAPTSYAGKLGAPHLKGWKGWVRRAFGYNPASLVATAFFYLLFITPLAFIAYQSVLLLYKMENDHFVLDAKMLAVRFLIVLPLATLSGFGLLSLRLYRRLYEEYNHKQRVMELYQSFGREIAESGNEEHRKALLTIMLNSVASKAWENVARHETESKSSDILSNIERATDDIAKVKAIVG